jgi:hypothetical protein
VLLLSECASLQLTLSLEPIFLLSLGPRRMMELRVLDRYWTTGGQGMIDLSKL